MLTVDNVPTSDPAGALQHYDRLKAEIAADVQMAFHLVGDEQAAVKRDLRRGYSTYLEQKR